MNSTTSFVNGTVHTVIPHNNGTVLVIDGDDETAYLRWAEEVELISGYYPWQINKGDRVTLQKRYS